MRALGIGATGMEAQQLNVEVISNNIAKLSTTGFKSSRAEFQDLLYQNMRSVGSNRRILAPSCRQVSGGPRRHAGRNIPHQFAGQSDASPTIRSISPSTASVTSRCSCRTAPPPIPCRLAAA